MSSAVSWHTCDEQTAGIDALIAEAEQFIELARERWAALIAAAVTGQTDVRERASGECPPVQASDGQ